MPNNQPVITLKPIGEIYPYENNPRINDAAVADVAESIQRYGIKQPLVVDKNGVIVVGHTRYRAALLLGIKEIPCIVSELTDEQNRAYRIVDNKTNEEATWDIGKLELEIKDLDLSEFNFNFDDIFDGDTGDESNINPYTDNPIGKLEDRFIIPPFSIFDTRQGYWRKRKQHWLSLGIDSGEGREDGLLGQGLKQLAAASAKSLTGTSIFDPVLAEIMYKWFCVENGAIYDCFAGGSVRGIVAEMLGYHYTGIDLRKQQTDANDAQAKKCGVSPTWICDDSTNVDKYLPDESVDMVFTCPPYLDLEQYSNDPKDLSNMPYEEFIPAYREIIGKACNKLKNNRFAAIVVANVRDGKGFYRHFVGDTIQAFEDAGLHFYNDIVLFESCATAGLRAGKQFSAKRKVVKCHQNVLVFFKGNADTIHDNYGDISFDRITDITDELLEE